MNKSVTLAICTKNKTEHFAECIKSITANSYSPFELLIVDSSSKEKSEIIKGMTTEFGGIYLRQEKEGLSCARNLAISASKGEIVIFTDDDCIVSPDFIWQHVTCYTLLQVACVTGRVLNPNPEDSHFEEFMSQDKGAGKKIFSLENKNIKEVLKAVPNIKQHGALKESAPIPWCLGSGNNMSFRRDVFSKIGLFDEALGAGTLAKGGEDLDIFFRLICYGFLVEYNSQAIVNHYHEHKTVNVAHDYGRGAGVFMLKHRDDPYILLQFLGLIAKISFGVISSLASGNKSNFGIHISSLKGLFSSLWYGRLLKN